MKQLWAYSTRNKLGIGESNQVCITTYLKKILFKFLNKGYIYFIMKGLYINLWLLCPGHKTGGKRGESNA